VQSYPAKRMHLLNQIRIELTDCSQVSKLGDAVRGSGQNVRIRELSVQRWTVVCLDNH